MHEEPFQVSLETGTLHGHVSGGSPPALLLHGGAAVTDYMDGCARELQGLVRTVRYQQRRTFPSETGPPYTIEAHVGDALAVLDHFAIDWAWAVGHSSAGHLALHLAGLHPDRLLGVVCIGTLGAFGDVFSELDANLRRHLSEEEISRIDEIEARRRAGDVTEAELLERWRLMWPFWFADPESAAPDPVVHIGPRSSRETNASISAHIAAGTLVEQLPELRVPLLFVHGDLDPLPARSSTETAALIPGAKVEIIPRCGHFSWLERPGELRQRVAAFLAR